MPDVASDRRRFLSWGWLSILAMLWLIAILIAFPFDQRIMNFIVAHRNDIWPWFGPVLAVFPFLWILHVLASFQNGPRLIAGFAAASILSTAITHLLKFIIGRARPLVEQGHMAFEPLTLRGELASFPSGHTTFAATLAMLFGSYWPRSRWVMALFVPAVAFERIMNDKHFVSDVLAGAFIGVYSVLLCRAVMGKEHFDPHRSMGVEREQTRRSGESA